MTTYTGVQLIAPITCHCERDIEYFLFLFAAKRRRSNLSTCTHFVISQRGSVEFNLMCLEHNLKFSLKLMSEVEIPEKVRPNVWDVPEIWRCQYFLPPTFCYGFNCSDLALKSCYG